MGWGRPLSQLQTSKSGVGVDCKGQTRLASKMKFHNMDVCGAPSCMERGGEVVEWSDVLLALWLLVGRPCWTCFFPLRGTTEPGVCAQTCEGWGGLLLHLVERRGDSKFPRAKVARGTPVILSTTRLPHLVLA